MHITQANLIVIVGAKLSAAFHIACGSHFQKHIFNILKYHREKIHIFKKILVKYWNNDWALKKAFISILFVYIYFNNHSFICLTLHSKTFVDYPLSVILFASGNKWHIIDHLLKDLDLFLFSFIQNSIFLYNSQMGKNSQKMYWISHESQ